MILGTIVPCYSRRGAAQKSSVPFLFIGLLEDLEEEIKKFPDMFTDDLKFLIKRYRPEIKQFIKTIKTK